LPEFSRYLSELKIVVDDWALIETRLRGLPNNRRNSAARSQLETDLQRQIGEIWRRISIRRR
jgi:hypothetical protein